MHCTLSIESLLSIKHLLSECMASSYRLPDYNPSMKEFRVVPTPGLRRQILGSQPVSDGGRGDDESGSDSSELDEEEQYHTISCMMKEVPKDANMIPGESKNHRQYAKSKYT